MDAVHLGHDHADIGFGTRAVIGEQPLTDLTAFIDETGRMAGDKDPVLARIRPMEISENRLGKSVIRSLSL